MILPIRVATYMRNFLYFAKEPQKILFRYYKQYRQSQLLGRRLRKLITELLSKQSLVNLTVLQLVQAILNTLYSESI